jgi:hypothetical protein
VSTALLDRLNAQYAPGWRPNPGDAIAGTVVALAERVASASSAYPVVTLRQEDGEPVALHAFHTVLRHELKAHNPAVGDTLAVKYLGTRQGARPYRPYHAYRVVVERAATTG